MARFDDGDRELQAYRFAVGLLNRARSMEHDHPELVAAHTEARHAFRGLADKERGERGKGEPIALQAKRREVEDQLFRRHEELRDAEHRIHAHAEAGGVVHRDQAAHHLSALAAARDQAFGDLLETEGALHQHYGRFPKGDAGVEG